MPQMKWLIRLAISIPSGLVAAVLITFPVHWGVTMVTACNEDGLIIDESGCSRSLWSLIDAETLERVAYSAAVPAAFVYVACAVMPVRKLWMPSLVAALWVAFFGLVTSFSVLDSGLQLDYSGLGWLELFVVAVLNIAVPIALAVSISRSWKTELRRMKHTHVL